MTSRHVASGGEQQFAVVLRLRGDAGTRPIGQPVGIEVAISNPGTADVWMVGVVDGSEAGIRYPHYRPSVMLDGVVVAAPVPPEDPLVGPLRVVDFTRLGPGEAFDPTVRSRGAAYLPLFTFAAFSPAVRGVYTYSLTVSTESDSPQAWLGLGGQEREHAAVLALIAQVPRMTTASNPLQVEVR